MRRCSMPRMNEVARGVKGEDGGSGRRFPEHKGSWYPDCPVSFGVCHSSSMDSGKPSSCSRAVREYLLSRPSVDRLRTGVPDHAYLFGTRPRKNYVRIKLLLLLNRLQKLPRWDDLNFCRRLRAFFQIQLDSTVFKRL